MTRALLLLAIWTLTIGAAGWAGSSWRGARDAARLAEQRQLMDRRLAQAFDVLSVRENELWQVRQALAVRAQEHEDAVAADPDACRRPSAESLQRLDRRWVAP